MNMDQLKQIGKAESKLAKIKIDIIKEKLAEFADEPEVAKALDYMSRFNQELPEGHPVFKRMEELKIQKDNKALLKNEITIQTELTKKSWAERDKKIQDQDKARDEENAKKVEEATLQYNQMIENLEKEMDKTFDFLSKNQRVFTTDFKKAASVLKARRFLIAMKNGFKLARIK